MKHVSFDDFFLFLLISMQERCVLLPTAEQTWHRIFASLHQLASPNSSYPECLKRLRFEENGFPYSKEVHEHIVCFYRTCIIQEKDGRCLYSTVFLAEIETSNASILWMNKLLWDRIVAEVMRVTQEESQRS